MSDDEALEAFVDESIRRSTALGYSPNIILEMRKRWGTKETANRLVINGDIQEGFEAAIRLGLLDWTLEAAVLKFPSLFSAGVREAAQWRLDQASSRAAVDLGRRGGVARAAKLTADARTEIARKGAAKRWGGKGG